MKNVSSIAFRAAWTTFGTYHIQSSWAWRVPAIIQCFPTCIQVCLCLFGPESPRWLFAHGQ